MMKQSNLKNWLNIEKGFAIILFTLFAHNKVFCQVWSAVDNELNDVVTDLYSSVDHDILYIAGRFTYSSKGSCNKVIGYTHDSISILNSGLPGFYPITILEYKNEIYVTGYNDVIGEDIILIGVWDGQEWYKPNDTNSFTGPIILTSCVFKNEFVVLGDFGGIIKGAIFRDLAKWDGQKWDSLGRVYNFNGTASSSVQFNNRLYVGGILLTLDTITYGNVFSYDDTVFRTENIPQESGSISSLEIHNDTLYASSYDGTIYKLNNGVWQTTYQIHGIIIKLRSLDSKLYVVGEFDSIQGVQAKNVGYIENGIGYGFAESPNNRVLDIESYKGNLYIGGIFESIGSKPIKYLARWGSPVGVEGDLVQKSMRIQPNPSKGQIHILLPKQISGNISIYNLKSEVVLIEQISNKDQVQLITNLSPGIYIVEVLTNMNEHYHSKFVIENH